MREGLRLVRKWRLLPDSWLTDFIPTRTFTSYRASLWRFLISLHCYYLQGSLPSVCVCDLGPTLTSTVQFCHIKLSTITYMHTYIHLYTYIHTFIYIRTYIHTFIHIHSHVHTNHKYIHIYIHTYIHLCTCVHIFKHIHFHAHTYRGHLYTIASTTLTLD